MPLDETSIAGYVALTGEPVNVADAYHLPEGSPYTISRSFDEKSGYRTKSMLVVPMRDHQDVVIGVVQLINKKRDPEAVLQPASLVDEQVIPFTAVDAEARRARSPARPRWPSRTPTSSSGSGSSSTTSSTPPSPRSSCATPPTSGHSERVAELTVGPRREGRRRILRPLRRPPVHARPAPGAALRRAPARLRQGRGPGEGPDQGEEALRQPDGRGPAALRLHPEGARGRATCGRSSRRSSAGPASPESLGGPGGRVPAQAGRDEAGAGGGDQGERADRGRGGELPAADERARRDPSRDHEAEERFPVEDWAQAPHLSAHEVEALSIRKGSL